MRNLDDPLHEHSQPRGLVEAGFGVHFFPFLYPRKHRQLEIERFELSGYQRREIAPGLAFTSGSKPT